jgi:hypothetical protein
MLQKQHKLSSICCFDPATCINAQLMHKHMCRMHAHAARLELRNYPTDLLRLKTPLLRQMDAADAKAGSGGPERYLDMGAVDVWRGREARLPLWNDFRQVWGCCRASGGVCHV